MNQPGLNPYQLPEQVEEQILALAQICEVLLIGEMHGTQEIPGLALRMLQGLTCLGYTGLAFEIPCDVRELLVGWVEGKVAEPPAFFTHPTGDGRGNMQVLNLVRRAVESQWQILCFDTSAEQAHSRFGRDTEMANNLIAQRKLLCGEGKVLGICGNMHSLLEPKLGLMATYWPSMAGTLEQSHGVTTRSINVLMHQGTLYSGGQVHSFERKNVFRGPLIQDGRRSQHTLELHLPWSTAATLWSAT